MHLRFDFSQLAIYEGMSCNKYVMVSVEFIFENSREAAVVVLLMREREEKRISSELFIEFSLQPLHRLSMAREGCVALSCLYAPFFIFFFFFYWTRVQSRIHIAFVAIVYRLYRTINVFTMENIEYPLFFASISFDEISQQLQHSIRKNPCQARKEKKKKKIECIYISRYLSLAKQRI